MSGGYFGYYDGQLASLSEQLDILVSALENDGYLIPYVNNCGRLKTTVEDVIMELNYCHKVLNHVDYFLSDDISEDTMWERIDKVEKEISGGTNN
jgi:hypothetical protein